MINNVPADHPPPRPPPHHVRIIDVPPRYYFPIFVLLLISCLAFRYKLKHPIVTIDHVEISHYTLSSIRSTVSFSLTFHTTIKNPTHQTHHHFSYEAELFYANQQIGFMFPVRKNVLAQVSVNVKNVPISEVGYIPAMFGIAKTESTMELDLKVKMKLKGARTILWLFGHQVESSVERRVTIAVSDGSVLSFHC